MPSETLLMIQMHIHIGLIALLLSSIPVFAQYQTIFHDTITNSSLSTWTTERLVDVQSSPYCPWSTQCFVLNQAGDLWHYISTTDFHSIQVHYALRSDAILSATDKCEFWYEIGNNNNAWIELETVAANDAPVHRTVSISAAENQPVIGIGFYLSSSSKGACYISNVTVTGIRITNPPIFASVTPTFYPTVYPTIEPTTMIPTLEPTTMIPSISPTFIPSTTPTFSPTVIPSSTPSELPSADPTSAPNAAPSVAPTIFIDSLCRFSDDYLKIFILFNGVKIDEWRSQLYDSYTMKTRCDNIFVNSSLLGDSDCMYTDSADVDMITVALASNAVINVYDVLIMPQQMFSFVYNNEVRSNSQIIFHILPSNNPKYPVIVANIASIIGLCDNLILNAANSVYLGGRRAVFKWKVSSSSEYTHYGALIIVDANDIDANSTAVVQLYLTSWYNITVTETFTVYKSKEPLPHIAVSGPQTYSVSNRNYNRDYIHISAIISYRDDCMTDNGAISFPYSLFWSLSPSNAPIESYLLQKNEVQNADYLAVDTSLISPGNKYMFTVTASCNDATICNEYNVSDSLQLIYEWSDIMCSMYSTNTIYLNTLTATQLKDYILYLDGYTMTYDPETDMSDKSHLKWHWKCSDNSNTSCDYLFNSLESTSSSKRITFQNEANKAYYFQMTVYDESNDNRSHCVDTLDVYIDIIDGESSIKYIAVLVRTSANVIRSGDRLRLMVTILNDEIIDNRNTYYQYEWREINEDVTSSDLMEWNVNSGTNGNLILKENTLQKGKTYQFQVNVTKMTGGVIVGYGVSPLIEVYILDGPTISEVILSPSCDNVTYTSLTEALTTFYHISVIAEAEYRPLSYEFVYLYEGQKHSQNMHRSVLSEPYILDVLLPIGNFSIKSIVYDAKSSLTEHEIQCRASIMHAHNYNDSDECISFKDDIVKHLQHTSNYQFLLYLLQSTDIYLNYVEEDDLDSDCVQLLLPEIIEVYHEFLIQNNATYNFCQVDWSLFMAKIFTKYIKLWMEFDIFMSVSQLHIIQLWIALILNPCSALTEIVVDIDLLFVSPQSIIDGNVIISYDTKENDITRLLNNAILSDHRNAYVLYELSASLIQFVNDLTPLNNDESLNNILDLLSKSLYIQALFQISSSIPGESSFNDDYDEFKIYFTRIDTNGMLNTSVDHIQITIPNTMFSTGRDSFCDITEDTIATNCAYNSVDVVIVSQNNTKTNASVTDSKECAKTSNASLSHSAISIVLIGGNTTRGNISIRFNDEQVSGSNYNDIECVWFDEANNIWKDTGCNTMIHHESQSIECYCSHITTFSLVHNINFDGCNLLLHSMTHSIKWRFTHIVFAVLFLFIFCYALREVLPFILHKHYDPVAEKALLSMSLIGIISCIHIIVCAIFIFMGSGSNWYQAGPSSLLKAVLTFLLMSPQWIYFVIFSIVLYSWIMVSYRSTSASADKGTKVGKPLVICTICFTVYGVCDFIFISFIDLSSNNHWYYSLSQIVWIVFTVLATIIFAIFGCWTQAIVRQTAAVLETQHISSIEIRLANKLVVVTIVIILFFVLQCVLMVYFLIFSEFNHNHMLQWRICDLSSNFICLCFVAALYKNTLNRLRAEFELKAMCSDGIKRCKDWKLKCILQHKKKRQISQLQKPTHIPTDSVTSPRKVHDSYRTPTVTETATDAYDREVELGVYRISNTVPLPALTEMKEKKAEKKRKSAKLEVPQVIFERKELLKEKKAKLARKCLQYNLAINGTKGDLVNRLVRYQRKHFIEANENSLTAESNDI